MYKSFIAFFKIMYLVKTDTEDVITIKQAEPVTGEKTKSTSD